MSINHSFLGIKPIFLYILKGLRHSQIGCKLQEAAAKYQSEGFSQIYLACAGTNTQKLVDLLKTMFGDLDLEDIDPEQLETDAIKALCQKATEAEEAAISVEHGPIPADKIAHITITSVPIPIEFRIPEASLPETKNIKMPSTKNPAKKVTHFDYCCRVCSHSLQNKPSMMTHTRKCLVSLQHL